MGGVRPVLVAAAVVVLLTGALAVMFVDLGEDREPWESAGIRDVAFAKDRASILVLPATWEYGSCFRHRVKADRNGSEWNVRLEGRRTAEFCPTGACIHTARTIAEAYQPEHAAATALGCPAIFSLDLDEPAPSGVVLVADG